MQAPAAPGGGPRAGLTRRQRRPAALWGRESSGLVTLTESAEDAAGGDDAEMEEEVVGKHALPMALSTESIWLCLLKPSAWRCLAM